MLNIKHHLPIFIGMLKRGDPVKLFSNGNFYKRGFFWEELSHFFGLSHRTPVITAKAYSHLLDELETEPISFTRQGAQALDFSLYLEAGDLLLQPLYGCSGGGAFAGRVELERRLIALRYRLEEANGGWNAGECEVSLYHQLWHAASVWKASQSIFDEKDLDERDRDQLQEAARYPFFAKFVLGNHIVAEAFFLWALRDGIAVRPFIEFPCHQTRINKYGLNGRLSRRGGRDLSVQKKVCSFGLEKILTLPFEGRPLSILDESKTVLLRGGYGLTIKEVFEIFDGKKCEAGNLEFMDEGIINWNSHHWGYWDAVAGCYRQIDLDQDQWWNDLPVLDRLSLREARRRFGGHLSGSEWNLALISSRLHQDLNFEDAHSYLSLSVPQKDGSYVVYTMGKCTFTFPKTQLQALINIGETSSAAIAYPDENVFYTHRKKTHFSYAISEDEGLKFFASLKREVRLSREGNLVYQIESENCAKWSYEQSIAALGHRRVPEIYRMPFLNSTPRGGLLTAFKLIKSLPDSWQIPVTICIHFLFGGYKGKLIVENGQVSWKSLTRHSFWRDTVIFHPSMLYKRQEEGKIGFYVRAGITAVRCSVRHIERRTETFFQKIFKLMALNTNFLRNKCYLALFLIFNELLKFTFKNYS